MDVNDSPKCDTNRVHVTLCLASHPQTRAYVAFRRCIDLADDRFVTPCWKVQSGLLSTLSHPDPTPYQYIYKTELHFPGKEILIYICSERNIPC